MRLKIKSWWENIDCWIPCVPKETLEKEDSVDFVFLGEGVFNFRNSKKRILVKSPFWNVKGSRLGMGIAWCLPKVVNQ